MKNDLILKLTMSANAIIDSFMSTMVIFVNIAFFIVVNNARKPFMPTAFVLVVGFYIRLCASLGSNLTRALNSFANYLVSCGRVEKFLLEKERNHQSSIDDNHSKSDSNVAIKLTNMSTSFSNDSVFSLKQIDLTIKQDEFVCIFGPVGSGKVIIFNYILYISLKLVYILLSQEHINA